MERGQGLTKTLVTDAREAVDLCAGVNIRLAARRITRFLDMKLQATGLSSAQFGLLTHIATAPDDTIGALAERMDLDQSTLSRTLRGLERAGLIEIAAVEKDQRKRAVWLTESGARRLEAAISVWRAAHSVLRDTVDPAQVRDLAAAMDSLTDDDSR